MRIIDLTHTIEKDMPVFPGDAAPVFEKIGDLSKGDASTATQFQMTSHMGTHLDCNSHVFADGFYTDREDLEFFYGEGLVIDCQDYEEGTEIGLEILQKYDFCDKSFLLFYTGWSRYWGTDRYYGNYPLLSDNLLKHLANSNCLKGIGLDYISLDRIDSATLEKHNILLQSDKSLIENLNNLEQLIDVNFTFMALPLKFKNGDGSPVRAAAIVK